MLSGLSFATNVTANGRVLSAIKRSVKGPGSAISIVDLAANRLMSKSTSSWRCGRRIPSSLSTTGSVETIASTVDLNTKVGGKSAVGLDLARAATRFATARVSL